MKSWPPRSATSSDRKREGTAMTVAGWLAQLGVALTPYAWATHILLGLAIQAVIALPLRAAGVTQGWWIGAAVPIGSVGGGVMMNQAVEDQRIAWIHRHANSAGQPQMLGSDRAEIDVGIGDMRHRSA